VAGYLLLAGCVISAEITAHRAMARITRLVSRNIIVNVMRLIGSMAGRPGETYETNG